MKKSRRMFSLAMLVCLIVGVSTRNQRMYRSRMCAGIRKCNTRTGRFREENGG